MYPQKAKRSIEHLSQRKLPVFLWGPPGIGKSSIVAQIAKEQEIGFIDLRLSLLDPTDLRGIPFFNANDNKAFATPRTWAYVNEILLSQPEEDILMEMVSGAIGEELAASFLGFRAVAQSLPDIEGILDGTVSQTPTDTSALHLLCTPLTMRIDDETRSKELDNLLKYTLNLPEEFAVMIVQDLRQRDISLDYVNSWALWLKKFNTLLH